MNKKNKPCVSIIVPVYNVEKYIEKCLDSLVNQTLENIEIVIVNDGSPDKSQKIIDKYEKKYKQIKSYVKENGGVSSARNYGIEKANGDYITFVDSDDYVELDFCEKLYKKAIQGNFDIVVCDLKYIYPNKTINISSKFDEDINDKEKLKLYMTKMYPVVWNKLFKKELFEKNIRFKLNVWYEDVEFLHNLYPYIKSIGVIKESLYNYFQRDGSITYVFDKRLYDYVYNWDSIISFYKEHKLYNEYKEELEYSHVRYVYATFVKRLANIKNKKEYDEGVNFAINKIKSYYPNYKKNKYLKSFSFKNIYLKYFNKTIANFIYIVKKMR